MRARQTVTIEYDPLQGPQSPMPYFDRTAKTFMSATLVSVGLPWWVKPKSPADKAEEAILQVIEPRATYLVQSFNTQGLIKAVRKALEES